MRFHPLLAAAGIICAPILLLACAPRAVTRAAGALFPGCRYDGPLPQGKGRPLIALTIDDAPDRATTPAILDTLRTYASRATFFVITTQLQAATGAPDPILTRMRGEGHEVGNHLTRDRVAIRLDSATYEADLAQADSLLERYGPVHWARPGSGLYSRRMVRAMHRAGYECALRSVYPVDAGLGWRWLSERYILAHARPGAIIILHDRDMRGHRTAAVLGNVLPALRARGYEVVTLSELAAAGAGTRAP
jgi:peptidoglycan/xylan/chitin deacetylase (PgdA/CDA1 family)